MRTIFKGRRLHRTPRWWLILNVLLMLGCDGLNNQSTAAPAAKTSHILVIDAGSSGSRLYAYRVTPAQNNQLPKITLMGEKKVVPGISAFDEDPSQWRKNIDDLILAAKGWIPAGLQRATPCYLMATAGMRLLNEGKRAKILNEIDRIFKSEGSFDYRPAVVISGAGEGLYGWLAVNYLDDGFDPRTRREGMLEMGGASTQIAYLVQEKSSTPNIVRRIRGRLYRIYTKSYLYLGANQARKSAATVNCYPDGFPLGTGEALGQGNFERCSQSIRENFTAFCENLEVGGPHCLFKQPPPKAPPGEYVALSAYYYLYEFLKPDAAKDLISVYYDGGTQFCARDWETIKKEHPGDALKFLKNYCFSAAYFWTLLSEGFNLDGPGHRVQAHNDINNIEVSWTLGAVIDIGLGHAPEAYKPQN